MRRRRVMGAFQVGVHLRSAIAAAVAAVRSKHPHCRGSPRYRHVYFRPLEDAQAVKASAGRHCCQLVLTPVARGAAKVDVADPHPERTTCRPPQRAGQGLLLDRPLRGRRYPPSRRDRLTQLSGAFAPAVSQPTHACHRELAPPSSGSVPPALSGAPLAPEPAPPPGDRRFF